MKTETQIAKEYIEELEKIIQEGIEKAYTRAVCKEHKTSCQRFLDFLEGFEYDGESKSRLSYLLGKMVDLKQAIKLYDEAGV